MLEITNQGELYLRSGTEDIQPILAIGARRAIGTVRANSGGVITIDSAFGGVIVGDNGLLDTNAVFLRGSDDPDFGLSPGVYANALSGSGVVRANDRVEVREFGVIAVFARAPGDADVLRIEGDVVFQPGGSLNIGVADDGTGSSLEVTGAATINGGILNAFGQDAEWSVARRRWC